ncbi:MAG: flavodoxin family protein [Lachnospiraceae bacterium]|nr:flavodoxin family protein [Lachnospiraceae bacterium]
MSKKVIIVSSSPRKGGNSDLLCDSFAKGAIETGNEVEKIYVKDMNFNYCCGCGFCVGNKGQCSQKDDMDVVKEKLIAADTIVFATPVYFYTMSGQLKKFIDRLCYFYTQLSNKEFYFIMTAADGERTAMDRVLTEFDGLLTCLDNPIIKGAVYGTGVWEKGTVKDKPVMQEAYEMGKNL